MILHFVELGVVNQLSGVLLCIKRLLLQGGIQLAESQRAGIGAQSSPDCQVDLVLHDADLQTLQILQRVDLLVAGELTEAVFEIAQALESGRFQGIQQSLTSITVQCRIRGFAVGEQEGSFESVQCGDKGCDVGRRGTAHSDVALGCGLGVLTVTAQLLVGIQIHRDSTAGALFNQFFKLQEAEVFRSGFCGTVSCDDVQRVISTGITAGFPAVTSGFLVAGTTTAGKQCSAQTKNEDQR